MRRTRLLGPLVIAVAGLAGCYPHDGGGPPTTTTTTTTTTDPGVAELSVVVPDITLSCDGQSCQGSSVITVTNTGTGPTTVAPVLSGPFNISQGSCDDGPLSNVAGSNTCTGSVSVGTIDPSSQGGGGVSTGGTVVATAGSVVSNTASYAAATP